MQVELRICLPLQMRILNSLRPTQNNLEPSYKKTIELLLIMAANGPCIPNVIDFFEYHPITPLLNILN